MLNMHMTESDISELVRRYIVGPDLIRYIDFERNIDEQFYDYELAKNNLETTKSVSVNKMSCKKEKIFFYLLILL
jgi:hypothetical protein